MGYRHSRQEILDGALDAALDVGLSRLTFGVLARRLGISDRIVVYYFPSKGDLLTAVLAAIGAHMQEVLGPALRARVGDHVSFVEAVWPTLAQPRFDRVFALFFEASGLAAARTEPYRTLVPVLVEGWIDWAAQSIDGDARQRKTEAAAAVALLDGLLLMRQLAGAETANRAAKAFGRARPRPG